MGITKPPTTMSRPVAPPTARGGGVAEVMDRDRDNGDPDDQRADAHPPEQVGDALGVTTGRVERGLGTVASGEQRDHRDEHEETGHH